MSDQKTTILLTTDAERLATLESEVRQIIRSQAELKREFKTIDEKLDDILALRNRGAGVFWFMSALAGTGVISGVIALLEWVRYGH